MHDLLLRLVPRLRSGARVSRKGAHMRCHGRQRTETFLTSSYTSAFMSAVASLKSGWMIPSAADSASSSCMLLATHCVFVPQARSVVTPFFSSIAAL